MAGGWWCCCQGCWSFSDSFCCPAPQYHCDPYPNLGVYWEPLPKSSPVGDWWVDGDACLLIEDGTPGAIIRNTPCVPAGPLNDNPADCAPENPGDPDDCHCLETAAGYTGRCTPYMKGSVTVLAMKPEGSWSLLLRMLDENNYIEARVVWDTSEDIWFQIWQKVAGVEGKLSECGPYHVPYDPEEDNHVTINMCVTKNDIHAYIAGLTISGMMPDVSPPTIECGFHGGVKHGNSFATVFTDYSISQLVEDHPDCPACGECICSETPPKKVFPRKMALTFFDLNGNWSGLDGYTIEVAHPLCAAPVGYFYRGVATAGCLAPRGSKQFVVVLECESISPTSIPMLVLNSDYFNHIPALCCGIAVGAIPVAAPEESSCHPFELVYYYSNVTQCLSQGFYAPEPLCSGTNPGPCCNCGVCDCYPPPLDRPCNVNLKITLTDAT